MWSLNSRSDRILHSQRGDTIVEVLIATAIITLVLVSAYAITNRNSIAAQDTQEHMKAARLVESQIEALRSKTQADIAAGSLTNFCIDTTDAALPLKNADDTTTYPCVVDKGLGGAEYSRSISDIGNKTYKVSVEWTSLAGKSNNDANVTMYYRIAQ